MDCNTKFDRAAHCRQIASRGGRATAERHGRDHMRQIGRKGFEATTARYFAGQGRLHVAWLVAAGARAYYSHSGLSEKLTVDGRSVWPEAVHPARLVPIGQRGLFEGAAVRYEPLPF